MKINFFRKENKMKIRITDIYEADPLFDEKEHFIGKEFEFVEYNRSFTKDYHSIDILVEGDVECFFAVKYEIVE